MQCVKTSYVYPAVSPLNISRRPGPSWGWKGGIVLHFGDSWFWLLEGTYARYFPFDFPRKPGRNALYKWFNLLNTARHDSLSLSPPVCLFTRTLFPPNRQLCWFYPFPSLHGNSFLSGQRALALSLVPGGPVARIHCSHCLGLASVSGRNWNPALSHCSPRQLRPTLCELWTTAGAGCRFLLQGIFLIQGSNPHLLHLLYWQVDSVPRSHLRILWLTMGNN